MARRRYALGYLSADIGTDTGVTEAYKFSGDPTLEDIIRRYSGDVQSQYTWKYAKELLEHVAFKLIGPLREWIRFNIRNNSGANPCTQAYLLDTVAFIMSGKRSQDQNTWMELHLHSIGTAAPFTAFNDENMAASFMETPDADLYSMWISHPNGILDLASFLQIVFGADALRKSEKP